jgi:peptidase E
MPERQIVGIGGGGDTPEQMRTLLRHVLSLTGKERPRVVHVPTAMGDTPEAIVWSYERLGRLCDLSHVRFFPYPPEDLRELVLAQDAIYVGGGNVANMLAIWKVHGFGELLREAWEHGIVLFGVSAGMLCWFEAVVTDSFGLQLEGLRDGLGFLSGSACPHYDGEERRRPRYRELVDSGFPGGIAAEDGVGLHYVGTELREVVTCRPGATAFRVTRDGEERLGARELGSRSAG